MTAALRRQVAADVAAGTFPVVHGGDCAALLGIVAGLGDAGTGPPGLLHVDGHEDAMPLDVSEDGEAANAEIGLLLGLTGRTLRGPLADGLPALDADRLALLGTRDAAWRARFAVASLAGVGVPCAGADVVGADPVGAAARAASHVRAGAERWWLHVDLDVLDPRVFAAQGLPDVEDEPGGLDWPALRAVVATALEGGGCAGLSLAIYDPDQDPTGADAERIVALVRDVAPQVGAH